MIKTLLLATSNAHKIREMQAFFQDAPLTIRTLADIDVPLDRPIEDADTLLGNAVIKAKWYAQQTGMLTLADDSGLFVHACGDWPGVASARIAQTNTARRALVLEALQSHDSRSASFRTALALHNPIDNTTFVSEAEETGEITHADPTSSDNAFTYDPIFFIPEVGKTYAELSMEEKNARSHRGKALQKMCYHIDRQYSAHEFVVPLAIIVRDGQILMNKRNDPHNPEYHEAWEFPGGGIEFGETAEQALIREVREESGYEIAIISHIGGLYTDAREGATWKYQAHILFYVCSPSGEPQQVNAHEVLESRWFDPDAIIQQRLIGNNASHMQDILPELKNVIRTHNL